MISYSNLDFDQLHIIMRWPVVLMFLFFTIKIVYMVTPRYRFPGKYGALFTSTVWVVSTFAYSYYLNHFNNQYSDLYGDFANVIVLIMWMYILSYVFTLGISINAYHYRIKQAS
ncbi:YihY/virulence factor BrkB family protein [Paenibacillus sp. JZ16]|uniref:YihY/virulence factor BrkB family protein n=1 Tax=Paenibacillus sp. JZ16 TaxID=1906272 RepID=UPI003FA6F7DA